MGLDWYGMRNWMRNGTRNGMRNGMRNGTRNGNGDQNYPSIFLILMYVKHHVYMYL